MATTNHIKPLIDALDEAVKAAVSESEKTKCIASQLKEAHNALTIYVREHPDAMSAPLDVDVARNEIGSYLSATDLNEKLIYATNSASTTLTALSGALMGTQHVGGPSCPNTAEYLREQSCPIAEPFDILKTHLNEYSPHLSIILDGAKSSLDDVSNELRSSNVSNNLRELLREFMAKTSPDSKIKLAKWFVPDETSDNGVTRRHRLQYAIYGFVCGNCYPTKFVDLAEKSVTEILATVKTFSKLTHTTAKTLSRTDSPEDRLFRTFIQQMLSLLHVLETSKLILTDELQMALAQHLDDVFINDFFDDLGTLSSHTRPTGAADVEVTIRNMDADRIRFSGTGLVECDLQMGSDGDCRRGDGAEWAAAFPFRFEGSASTSDLSEIEVPKESIDIDTSKYYDER